jgi:hypothetical protein
MNWMGFLEWNWGAIVGWSALVIYLLGMYSLGRSLLAEFSGIRQELNLIKQSLRASNGTRNGVHQVIIRDIKSTNEGDTDGSEGITVPRIDV